MSCTGLETRKPIFEKKSDFKKIEKLKFDEDSMDTDVDKNFWIVAIDVASHELFSWYNVIQFIAYLSP